MAYDEAAARRSREVLGKYPGVTERKMFGGLAFLLDGHMCCGVLGGDLMVRVGPRGYEAALSRPHTRKMDFTGKPLTGFVFVGPAGFGTKKDLDAWIGKAAAFVRTLPPKR